MTWPLFKFDQEDLCARSREPEIYDREYYLMNHLYGGAEILRQYAGLPEGRPVPWALQPVMRFFGNHEREIADGAGKRALQKLVNSGLPHRFTINEAYASKLRELQVPGVEEIGAMFFYARELYRRQGLDDAPALRRGTIALPDKSDILKVVDFDREAYAAKLAALPQEYQPVYVSMHWRDYERGCHEPYLRAGLRMVCSGHCNDPLFYQRFYDVCRQFKYSCSNEISTSFALSVLSGCQFFFLDGGEVTIRRDADPTPYLGPEPTLEAPGKKAAIEVSPFPPSEGTRARQREIAAMFAGEEFQRLPAFFQERWASGRRVLSEGLDTEDLSLDQPTPVFSHWLPFGFDVDGWADPVCGLEVPWRPGWSGVEMELGFVLPREAGEPPKLAMTLDEDKSQASVHPVTGSIMRLQVPLREDGGARQVRFDGPAPVALLGEQRCRSFRLVKIRWVPAPSAA